MAAEVPMLVLASASATRGRLLAAAGLCFEVLPAAVDEDEIKRSLHAEGAPVRDAAAALAAAKAGRVARRRPGALVIGADQILECGGVWYDKPPDLLHARAQLMALRGREHRLATAVCVMRDDTLLWQHGEAPQLTMRPFSDAFLEAYMAASGADVLRSVGAYLLEGPGVQLFSRIVGDYFAILGLPLLPLLEFLRGHGVVPR
ncbi:MAG: Maf family protein [Alphaproteobacteria bacterium]|nr:Maf family protein [Alphaproteobacteria bacterium]